MSFECLSCSNPWPYKCDECQQQLIFEESCERIAVKKLYVGSGEDLDLEKVNADSRVETYSA